VVVVVAAVAVAVAVAVRVCCAASHCQARSCLRHEQQPGDAKRMSVRVATPALQREGGTAGRAREDAVDGESAVLIANEERTALAQLHTRGRGR